MEDDLIDPALLNRLQKAHQLRPAERVAKLVRPSPAQEGEPAVAEGAHCTLFVDV